MSARARSERIDQLRGLAALAVVACHLGVSAYRDAPNQGGTPWPWLGFVLGFGYLGVPLFFVISGFCIHLLHRPIQLALEPLARRVAVRGRARRAVEPHHHAGRHAPGALGLPRLLPLLRGRARRWPIAPPGEGPSGDLPSGR